MKFEIFGKRFFASLATAVALATALPSCMEESLYEEATLKLSDNPVFFTRDASEKSVSVQTNREKWEATSAQEGSWLNLKKEGNQLKISVAENMAGSERTAVITVHAGDISERIEVRQASADVSLRAEISEIKFVNAGGAQSIRLFANVQEGIKVEAEGAEWLKVSYQAGAKAFDIEAEENTSFLARSAKLVLSAGQYATELSVKQDGVLDLALPLLTYPASLKEVSKYEEAREHVLVRTPDGFQNKTAYRFNTGNKTITFVEYEYSKLSLNIFDKAWAGVDDANLMKGGDFDAFMLSRGFVKGKGTSKQQSYSNETLNFNAMVNFTKDGGAVLTLTYAPKQTKEYPTVTHLTTFDLIPLLGSYDDKNMPGARKDQVLEFEQKLGSTLNKAESKDPDQANPITLTFDPKAADAPEIMRMYQFIKAGGAISKKDKRIGELEQSLVILSDPKYVFWQFDENWILTRELDAFMQSKGYVYHSKTTQGFDRYYNPTAKAVIAFRVDRLEDFNNKLPFVIVSSYRANFGDESVSSTLYEAWKAQITKK